MLLACLRLEGGTCAHGAAVPRKLVAARHSGDLRVELLFPFFSLLFWSMHYFAWPAYTGTVRFEI